MSDTSIPAPDDQHKTVIFFNEGATIEIVTSLLLPSEAKPLCTYTLRRILPPCDADRVEEEMLRSMTGSMARTSVPTPAKPPRGRPRRPRRARPRSGKATPYKAKRAAMEDLEIRRLRRDGFTPYFGEEKRFYMTPPEFDLVLACESRQVAQVIYEVLRQSVGYAGDGEHGRREWVALSQRHFERRGLMGQTQAQRALRDAVEQGYLLRRRRGRQRWEYAVHYRQADIVPR